MGVVEFENERWQGRDQTISFRHRAAIELVESGSVLDVGSGDGLFLSLLRAQGIKGKGVDISETGVARSLSLGLDAELISADAVLPFTDASFDTVALLDVLEHLYDPEKLLAEAARVSKRHVIVSVPNFNSLPARLQMLFGRVPENNQPHKGHIYWFNDAGLRAAAKREGLRYADTRMNAVWERTIIGWASRLLVRIRPSLFALSFVVKLEK